MLFYRLQNINFPLLTCLGKETLYIYIMHPIILNAIRMIFMKIGFTSVLVWIVVMLAYGVGLPYVYALAARKIN